MPVDPKLFLAFVGVDLLLAIAPGPANLFSTANGMQRGKAAALIPSLVVSAGMLIRPHRSQT